MKKETSQIEKSLLLDGCSIVLMFSLLCLLRDGRSSIHHGGVEEDGVPLGDIRLRLVGVAALCLRHGAFFVNRKPRVRRGVL